MAAVKGIELGSKMRKLFYIEQRDVLIIKKLAKSRKISESEVVGIAVRELGLKEGIIVDPLIKIIGRVKAGKGQAVDHDRVIYEEKPVNPLY